MKPNPTVLLSATVAPGPRGAAYPARPAAPAVFAPAQLAGRLPWWRLPMALLRQPATAVGLALVLAHLAMALVGPLLAPYPATEFHMADRLRPPSAPYLLGTDQFGRDLFSRLLHGAPAMLLLSTSATALGLLLGVAVGLTTGYVGGAVDELLMRLMDALMSFPSLLLALLILTMVGPATHNVVIGIGVVFMPHVARVVRSAVLSERAQEYVQAARVRGEGPLYIMLRELLPNVRGPIVVEAAIRISYAILLGASLGFLGLGVQPPAPDWGLMISEARNFLLVAPWIALAPAAAIATLVVGLNLVADGLTHELDRRGK